MAQLFCILASRMGNDSVRMRQMRQISAYETALITSENRAFIASICRAMRQIGLRTFELRMATNVGQHSPVAGKLDLKFVAQRGS